MTVTLSSLTGSFLTQVGTGMFILGQQPAFLWDSVFLHVLAQLLAVVIFSAIGIVVLAISFVVMDKLTPFSLFKEIEEDQNVALAIVLGAMIIGISLIIAAAIMG